jgi:hypothetical protein
MMNNPASQWLIGSQCLLSLSFQQGNKERNNDVVSYCVEKELQKSATGNQLLGLDLEFNGYQQRPISPLALLSATTSIQEHDGEFFLSLDLPPL